MADGFIPPHGGYAHLVSRRPRQTTPKALRRPFGPFRPFDPAGLQPAPALGKTRSGRPIRESANVYGL